MANRSALWHLCLLSLSLTNAVLAAGESSSTWSNILQLVGKPWSKNINGEQGELEEEMVREPSLKNYCESWRLNVELNNIRNFYAVPDECTSFVSKYMSSSQYKSDIHRAADEISLFLANSFSLGGDGHDAWVFDIDDTLISTLPFFKHYHFGAVAGCRGESTNRTLLEEWMAKGKAPAIDKMPELFHAMRGKGLNIFLISWRPEHLRSATVDNLIKAGIHGWTQLILRCNEEGSAGVQNYKSEQRKKLVNRGYRLWGNVGAQWSSLNGHPTAKRSFKLPNPLYYL